jgi:hypothetical protein
MAIPEDLGEDFACVTDLDANLSVVEGRTGLAQAVARRLGTPQLGLWYDPHYGYDIRSELGKPFGQRITAQRIEIESLKDERVNDALASVETIEVATSADEQSGDMNIDITITDDEGPFELTLEIADGVTALLLEETI